MLVPGGENHERCNRPRPAVCESARTTVPCCAPFLAKAKAKVLLEFSSSKISRDLPGTFDGSDAASISGESTSRA